MVLKSPYSDAKLSQWCSWCSLILLVRAEQTEYIFQTLVYSYVYCVRDFRKRSRNLNVKYANVKYCVRV